jgi:hypothetical protein
MADRYTKIMLTIIAACLLWNTFAAAPLVRQVSAQSGPVHVVVDAWGAYVATLPIPVRTQ